MFIWQLYIYIVAVVFLTHLAHITQSLLENKEHHTQQSFVYHTQNKSHHTQTHTHTQRKQAPFKLSTFHKKFKQSNY